jgi:hypothetical protein
VETLPPLCAEAFGADDRRASRAYLEALSLPELQTVFKDMVAKRVADALAQPRPDLLAFRALPSSEKLKILRNDLQRERFYRLQGVTP